MDEIKDLKTLDEWIKICPQIELLYIIEKLEEYKKALYMYSKFKIGDRIVLIKQPVINEKENWGLVGYEHHFIKNATAIIFEVKYHDGGFRYYFQFETCGNSVFTLKEEYFELAKNKICSECHREI